MRRLSSRVTWFYKWGFPALWFGFLGVACWTGARHGAGVFLAPLPVLFALLGLFEFRKVQWRCADRVDDDGEFLLVRRHGRQHRLPLFELDDASFEVRRPCGHIRLVLHGETPLGKQILFIPTTTFWRNPFARHWLVEELASRAARARGAREVPPRPCFAGHAPAFMRKG